MHSLISRLSVIPFPVPQRFKKLAGRLFLIGLLGVQLLCTSALATPNISDNPTALTYSMRLYGTPKQQTITVTNSGATPLNFSEISIEGVNQGDFNQTNTCSSQIPASGGTCTVTVTFNPVAEGIRLANLLISSDDPDTPIYSVVLNGNARTTRISAQNGLDYLMPATKAWSGGSCFGCHVQGQTIMAATIGKAHQYSVTDSDILEITASLFMGNGWLNDGSFSFGSKSATALGGRALAAYDDLAASGTVTGYPSYSANLVTTADWLYNNREADGRVRDDRGGVTEGGDIMTTANALLTWRQAYVRSSDPKYQNAINAAVSWLRSMIELIVQTPTNYNTQDKTFAILGLVGGGAAENDADIQSIKTVLLNEQNPTDGFWELSPGAGATSYSTGQALYALKKIGLSDTDPAILNGTNWLIDNQQDDGGWPTTNTGTSNPIASSMWPVIGLVSIKYYDIVVSAGTNGQVAPAGVTKVVHGGSQTYTFTPDAGYIVEKILVDGVPVGHADSYTLENVTAEHTLSVVFSRPNGDVDGNDRVDIADAVWLIRAALGEITLDAAQRAHGDVAPLVDGQPAPNGQVDLGDVVVLLRRVVDLVIW